MINSYISQQIERNFPYKPTDDQFLALHTLTEFLLSEEPDSLLLMKGYAGTGKTSLVGALVKTLNELKQKTFLLAPTGRAAMIDNEGLDSFVFGSGRLLDDLIQYVYSGENCRLILMGDVAQLPPVMQTESPALNPEILRGYNLQVWEIALTQVVRQSEDSGILFNATRLRDALRNHTVEFFPKYSWTANCKEMDFIANGEIIQVMRVRRVTEMYGFRFADITARFQDYDLEIDLKILLDTLQTDSPALPKELNDKLFYTILEDYEDIPTKAGKMKKMKVDPHYNVVQVKYAYAVTCHKAQGGQWMNVFLDIGYITEEMLGEDFYRWLYTAFTRATHHLYLVNLPDEFVE